MPRITVSRRVASILTHSQEDPQQNAFALPTHSSELGQMPVYEQSSEGNDGQKVFHPEWFADFLSTPQASEDTANASVHITEGSAPEAQSLDQYLYARLATDFFSTMFQDGSTDSQNSGANLWHTQDNSLSSNDVMSVWNDTPTGIE